MIERKKKTPPLSLTHLETKAICHRIHGASNMKTTAALGGEEERLRPVVRSLQRLPQCLATVEFKPHHIFNRLVDCAILRRKIIIKLITN